MEKVKYILSVFGGIIAAYFKQYAVLYIFVAVAIAFDLVTGMTAAVVEGTGLSSDIARKGMLKKMVLLVSVAFGTFLDVFLQYAVMQVGLPQGEKTLIFSTIICVYICITESISIIENIYRCTGTAIPNWILQMLKKYKDDIEKKGDEDNDRKNSKQ